MTTDDDSKRIRERMRERSALRARTEFSIDVMWVYAKGRKPDSCLCAVRGVGPAAEGRTLREALTRLADRIDKAVEAELLM